VRKHLPGGTTINPFAGGRSVHRENKQMSKRIPVKPINRSSITGHFVTERYAQTHPRTTEREHVPVNNPPKK